MPISSKKSFKPISLLTGQNTPKSNFFCQESLTKWPKFLENRDEFKKLSKMGKLDKGAALGSMMLGALAVQPALAEEPKAEVFHVASNVSQQVDCVAYAKKGATRADKKQRLSDCRVGKLDAQIAEQERVLKALNEQLAALNLQIDENARILDEQGNELAQIVAINGQLVMKIQQTDQQIAQKLQEAERILQNLARS